MESTTLHLYAPRATKKYDAVNVFIKDGRVHIKSLLSQYHLKSFCLINDETPVLVQHDVDGWSIWDGFKSGEIYRLRKEPDEDVDEAINFSKASFENEA